MKEIIRKIYNNANSIKIIMAHHVSDEKPTLSSCIISTSAFKEFIRDKSFVNIYDALENIKTYNGNYVLTFDDALSDLYSFVYPTLRESNIPFTAFISANLIDKPGYISTEQLKEMAENELVTIGSHGLNHLDLVECSDTVICEEILESKSLIESIIQKPVELFAYPYGKATQREINKVKKAGYDFAFGVLPRKMNAFAKSFNRFSLPRYNLTNECIPE